MADQIVIKVVLDTTTAQAGARQVGDALKNALDQPQVGDALRRTKSGIDGLGTSFKSLAGIAGTLTGLGLSTAIAAIGKAAFDSAVQLDKSRQTIAALTGSVDSANKKLAELRQLAQTSPGVTTSFATQLFAQFKAIGGIADESINKVIKSIGKLNAAFSLPNADQFARNLTQVFQQGFERADIKEALGQVPIFEQLLEAAFGTKDPNKLRALKDAGKLTLDSFLAGFAEAVQSDSRFSSIQESLGTKISKLKDEILTTLAPLGDDIGKLLVKGLQSLKNQLDDTAASFSAFVGEIKGLVGDLIGAFSSLNSGLIDTSLRKAIDELTGLVALARDLLSFENNFKNLDRFNFERDRRNQVGVPQALTPEAKARAGVFFDDQSLFLPLNGPALPSQNRPAASGGGSGRVGGGSRSRKTTSQTISEVDQLQKRLNELNREIKTLEDVDSREFQLRIKIDDAERAKQAIDQLIDKRRELGLPLTLDTTDAEKKLKALNTLFDITNTIKQSLGPLPTVDSVGPDAIRPTTELPARLVAEQERQKQVTKELKDLEASGDLRIVNLRTQQLEIQNAIGTGIISESDGRRAINALLREERDIQIAILEARKNDPGVSGFDKARIDEQIASIRNMGVELTNAQRFMKGFGSAVEDVGDIFDRFGQNVAKSFTNIKDLFTNLKNAVKQFFNDLLGNALQRLLQGTLGALFGGGASRGGSGGGGGIGGLFGNIFGGGGQAGGGVGLLGALGGFATPGFAGGFPALGGASGGAGGGGLLGNIFGSLFGGGGPAAPGGVFGTPPFNPGTFSPANQGSLLGNIGGSLGGGLLGGLGNLFKGIGFGLPPGAGAGGALAGALPLLGVGLGAGLGGQSTLGKILGGLGGGLLGVGLTAAPAALAGGALGFLAPLFSNPITAIIGGALLPLAFLAGRAKQRRSDEEASGQMLQASVDGILALKKEAQAGRVDINTARTIFETQILATFIAQINTLKTKSVRESRLTNQVRDLRNLFEKEVVPVAQSAVKKKSNILNLIPEFATGGIVPGRDAGVDSVLSYLRPGEMVLTKDHQSAIARIAGGDVFGRIGVPDAPMGSINSAPAFASGGVVPVRGGSVDDQPLEITVALNIQMGREDASRIVVAGATTSSGRRVIVSSVKRARLDGEL